MKRIIQGNMLLLLIIVLLLSNISNVSAITAPQYAINNSIMLINNEIIDDSENEEDSDIVEVSQILLDTDTLSLPKGDSYTLIATVLPENATNQELIWESDNTEVATVSDEGMIEAVAVGTANIIVTTPNGITATCKVEVISPITGVTLNKTNATVKKSKTLPLIATIDPSDYTENAKLTWSSSNTKVATVSNEGVVTAKTVGTATITVTVNSVFQATCKITVPYTITYKLNGGKNHSSNPATYYGKKITLKNPTRKGYTFKGWYSDSKFKKKVTSFSSGNQTLYAKWAKVSVAKAKTPKLTNNQNKLKISYSATSGAKGYQIQYATNKKFTSATSKTTTAKSATYTLSKGNTYYVRVRAYKLDSSGSKVYGKWSNIVSKKLPNSSTLYTTKTGKKYHKDGCSYLNKSKIPITRDEAKKRKLTPCSRCKP